MDATLPTAIAEASLITVIVPCHNEEQSILRTLQAIVVQEDANGRPIREWGEILVVDDESQDRSPAILAELCQSHPEVQVVRNDPRRGLAGSYNRAIKMAKSPLILTCHADCRMLDRQYVYRMLRIFDEPTVGAVTGKPLIPNIGEVDYVERTYLATHLMDIHPEPASTRDINFAEGRCDGFRRQAMIDVGLYDEKTRISGEDQIICNQLRQRGLRIVQDTALQYELSCGSSQNSLWRIIKRHVVLARGQAYVFLNSGYTTSKLAETSPNRKLRKYLRGWQIAGTPLMVALLIAGLALVQQYPVVLAAALALLMLRIAAMVWMSAAYIRAAEFPRFVVVGLACDVAYCRGFVGGLLGQRKAGHSQ